MSAIANPFDRLDLFIASEHHSAITHTVDRADPAIAFRRQIDAWWLALCVGVRNDERRPLGDERVKFIDGSIFSSDPWRITHLQLLGLNWYGSDALDRPRDIINTAAEFANAGFDWITETVQGAPNRTLAVYTRLTDVL